jgi:hypothetical protein
VDRRDPLSDEKFIAVLSEVVWGFHVYGRYGQEQKKAIKALTKRVPGYSAETYEEMFELSLNILRITIETVEKAPKSPKPGQEFREYSDVDHDFVIEQLRVKFPEQDSNLLKAHIGPTIDWFYLR